MAGTWQPVAFRNLSTPDGSHQSLTCHLNDGDGTWAVFGWTGRGGGRSRLTRLWLGLGDAPDLEMFDPWDVDSAGSISTAVLRSLNLTEAASHQASLQLESIGHQSPSLLFNGVHRDWLDTETARELGFRSVADLRAAVDRLEVAYLYAEQVAEGNAKPAISIAGQLGIPVETVRARLQRARTAKYLSSGGEGRAGGELTENAATLNRAIVLAVEKRTGEWLTDEQREQIFQEELEYEQMDRDLDTYLDK